MGENAPSGEDGIQPRRVTTGKQFKKIICYCLDLLQPQPILLVQLSYYRKHTKDIFNKTELYVGVHVINSKTWEKMLQVGKTVSNHGE